MISSRNFAHPSHQTQYLPFKLRSILSRAPAAFRRELGPYSFLVILLVIPNLLAQNVSRPPDGNRQPLCPAVLGKGYSRMPSAHDRTCEGHIVIFTFC